MKIFSLAKKWTLIIMTIFSVISKAEATSNKPLIIYFSQKEDQGINIEGVDSISGASIIVRNDHVMGSTEYIASLIQKNTRGDLVHLETVKDYPRSHDELIEYGEKQQQSGVRPELKSLNVNLSEYNTIFIGYPIWWYHMPMAIYGFLEKNDLSGKTIIPFTTHGGSSFSGSIQEIIRIQPKANVIKTGLSVSRTHVSDDSVPEEVSSWIKYLKNLDTKSED